MSKVFVDTVGFLALWDSRDQWHQDAVSAFAKVQQAKMELVSSEFVFLELGNATARKSYRDLVWQFRDTMERDGTLFSISSSELPEAWTRFRGRHASAAGIVD